MIPRCLLFLALTIPCLDAVGWTTVSSTNFTLYSTHEKRCAADAGDMSPSDHLYEPTLQEMNRAITWS